MTPTATILAFMWLAWLPGDPSREQAIADFARRCHDLNPAAQVEMYYAPPRWYTFDGKRKLYSGRDYFCVLRSAR